MARNGIATNARVLERLHRTDKHRIRILTSRLLKNAVFLHLLRAASRAAGFFLDNQLVLRPDFSPARSRLLQNEFFSSLLGGEERNA
jgi:hypothetical protein